MLNHGLIPTSLLALLITGCCSGGYGRYAYSPVGQTASMGRSVSYADAGSPFMRPGTTIQSPVVIHNAPAQVVYQNSPPSGQIVSSSPLPVTAMVGSTVPVVSATPQFGTVWVPPESSLPVANAPLINPPLITGQILNGGVVNGPLASRPLLNRRMAAGPIVNGPVVNGQMTQPNGIIATSPVILSPVTASSTNATFAPVQPLTNATAAEPAQPLPAAQKSAVAQPPESASAAPQKSTTATAQSQANPIASAVVDSEPAPSLNAVPNSVPKPVAPAEVIEKPIVSQGTTEMAIPAMDNDIPAIQGTGQGTPVSNFEIEDDISEIPKIETMSQQAPEFAPREVTPALLKSQNTLQEIPAAQPVTSKNEVKASDASLAWYPWPFVKAEVSTLSADRISDAKTLLSNRGTIRPNSIAAEAIAIRLENNANLAASGTHNVSAAVGNSLTFVGGRTLKDLAYVNLFLGGDEQWKQYEILKIDAAMKSVLADPQINEAIKKCFDGKPLRNVALPSHPLTGEFGDFISRADLHKTLKSLHEKGFLVDYDLDHTVFNILLPPGMVLIDDSVEMNSVDGIAGYHGSVNSQHESILYTTVVYSEKNEDGMENGLCAFESSWKNVVAVLHHQMQKVRTNPDAEEVLRDLDNPNAQMRFGWIAANGDEIGDQLLSQAKRLSDVFQEVELSDQSGSVPALLFSAVPSHSENEFGSLRNAVQPESPRPETRHQPEADRNPPENPFAP